ncbi:Kelch-like protein 10 [Nymphon striatum]|nr:Kelch-like protein 10 [Nymphon striatum]
MIKKFCSFENIMTLNGFVPLAIDETGKTMVLGLQNESNFNVIFLQQYFGKTVIYYIGIGIMIAFQLINRCLGHLVLIWLACLIHVYIMHIRAMAKRFHQVTDPEDIPKLILKVRHLLADIKRNFAEYFNFITLFAVSGMFTNTLALVNMIDTLTRAVEDFIVIDVDLKGKHVLQANSETEFPVSRSIMATCSRYFKTLFETKQSADLSKEKLIVTLPGIEERELKNIIEFAYVQPVGINDDNVQDLTVAADQFNVIQLLEECIEYLLKNMDHHNCIGLWRFSSFYSFIKLRNEAKKFILKNFANVLGESEEYYDLTVDELKDILDDGRLNVLNETIVWEAVLKWVEFDEERRINNYSALLRTVRIGFLFTDYVEDIYLHPYSVNNEECSAYFREYDIYTLGIGHMENVASNVVPSFCVPRKPSHVMYAIGGWSRSGPTPAIETYDYVSNIWTQVPAMFLDVCRAYHGSIAIGHNIYIIGGTDGINFSSDCYVFNTLYNAWSEIASMHVKRCYVSVAVLGHFVYAVGGNDGTNRLKTVEKYEISSNQWHYAASMNSVRSDAGVSVMDGKLYAIGGFDGTNCLNTVEMFDPDTNMWSNLQNMSIRRSGVISVVHQGYIYALGGSIGPRQIEKYREVIGNFIIVAGGFNGITTIRSVECYDICQNTWYYLSPMAIQRSALTVCSIENSYSTDEDSNSSTEDSH